MEGTRGGKRQSGPRFAILTVLWGYRKCSNAGEAIGMRCCFLVCIKKKSWRVRVADAELVLSSSCCCNLQVRANEKRASFAPPFAPSLDGPGRRRGAQAQTLSDWGLSPMYLST